MGLVFVCGGVAVFCALGYRFLVGGAGAQMKEKNQKVESKIQPHILESHKQFWVDFPDGIDDEKDIIERGEVIGRFMDKQIFSYVKLRNGWTFEFFDVARQLSPGVYARPRDARNVFLVSMFDNNLFYKMKFDEQNNPA